MKTCEYEFTSFGYLTQCGSELLLRPFGRCDKCGGKVKEVKRDAVDQERKENQESDD